jgi:hypothetical protein
MDMMMTTSSRLIRVTSTRLTARISSPTTMHSLLYTADSSAILGDRDKIHIEENPGTFSAYSFISVFLSTIAVILSTTLLGYKDAVVSVYSIAWI